MKKVEAQLRELRGPSNEPESRCANCGKLVSEATEVLADYPEEGEWFCSQRCKDQHDELGCPHEYHSGYRHPKEADRLIAAEGALRSLASWLGAGEFNGPDVDAAVFEEKIRLGVANLMRSSANHRPTEVGIGPQELAHELPAAPAEPQQAAAYPLTTAQRAESTDRRQPSAR